MNFKRVSRSILISTLVFLGACTGISLSQRITLTGKDWLMAGGNPMQQNQALSILSPPLNLNWKYNPDAGIGNSALSAADEVLFLNDLQGEMITLDVNTGGKLGIIKFLGKDASTTPYINENDIIITYAGDKYSVVSYNLMLAEINWRIDAGYIQTSPVPDSDNVYTGNLNGKEYKINKKTGKKEWIYDAKSAIHSTIAVGEDFAVFGTDDGNLHCLNKNDGTLKWKYKTRNSIMAAPLIYDNKIYVGSYDSNYYCLDAVTGDKLWKNNLSTKLFTGSALNNSSAIFGGIDGNLYSLNLSDGALKWKFHTNGVILSTPVSSGNYIYFTSFDNYIYCINSIDGTEAWKFQMEGKSKTSPIIWNDLLFTATDNYVYCFTNKPLSTENK